ncbi:MAG TPA: AMP-binding protein [Acidimicrobiales bacterium]|nr:AMP-binding protein [Acidimicrobiales bacterium]
MTTAQQAGPGEEVDPGIDVPARIAEVMAIDPAAPAIWYGDQVWTWEDCCRFGEQLMGLLGVPPSEADGLQLAAVMRNRPGAVSTLLRSLVDRCCLVPISAIQPPSGVAADLERLAPAAVVADAEDVTSELVGAAEAIGCAVVRSRGRELEVAVAGRAGEAARRPGVAVWMPTSGTTGPPKRLPITYRDLSLGFARVRRYSKSNEQAASAATLSTGVVVSATPLVHILGLWNVMQFAVEGRRLVLLDRFDAGPWSEAVAAHRPVVASLPPAALVMLLEAGVAPEKLSSLRAVMCSTAALAPEVERAFTERFGVPVLTTYGATEFPGGLSGWTLEDKRAFGAAKWGSVGRPRPGIQVRVVDPDGGAEVPQGTEGQIEVMSAQTVARGEAGWVRTTDLGRLDEDGFLWISGRADGAINRGGFKVLPEAVEAVLAEHPAVRAVGVVGLPDDRLGQVPVAAVELRSPASEDELVQWARARLAKYQVPVRVHVVDALPKTPSLKVSRAELARVLSEGAGA